MMGSHAWDFMHVRNGGNELKMSIGERNGSHGYLKNGNAWEVWWMAMYGVRNGF